MKSTLHINPLFGEGCVLQSGMPVRIWGGCRPGSTIEVSVAERRADAIVDADGAWTVTLEPLDAGGPYRMTVSETSEAATRESLSHDVYAGEVFICAGQSNMEYQMEFLHWRYPSEFTREADSLLRHCKVPVRFDFHGPRHEFDEPVQWVGAASDTLDEFTGIGYFFGRMIRESFGVPVGLLNITLGGSPIESWMDEETLAAWPRMLTDLAPYRNDDEARVRNESSIEARTRWHEDLRVREVNRWNEDAETGTVNLPAFLSDADPRLAGFRGVIRLRRTVMLPTYAVGRPAVLHLGAMVDSDITYVNGVEVGRSEHQYFSRDYVVPENVLKAVPNDVEVRLVCERGTGRFTPGKRMHLDVGDDSFDLSGAWRYMIGAEIDEDCPTEDSLQWKPLGLYNGMTATCAGYGARAVLWYQGESNTGDVADEYGHMLTAMIGCWRHAWDQERLPFLIVQLPVFSIDNVEDGGWALVRQHEWQVSKTVDDVATVVALDAGEWNDLHPWNKRVVAEWLFHAACGLVYGKNDAPKSPEPKSAVLTDGELVIDFAGGPLYTLDGDEPREFELVWEDGSVHAVSGRVEGDKVVIRVPWRKPTSIRYAWSNAPGRGLLCSGNGMPVPPFAMPIE